MPNRILKESICRSDSIDSLSWFEEVFFYRLIVVCDDFGRFDGRIPIIKGTCFPLKDVTNKDVEKALNKLSAVGLVRVYEIQGRPFLQLATWEQHQQIRAKKSKYPAFDNTCNQMISNVPVIQSNPNPIQSESNPNACVRDTVDRFLQEYPLPNAHLNRHLAEIAIVDCLLSGQVTGEQLIKTAVNYADKLKRLGKDREYQFIKKPENFIKEMEYRQYLPEVYEPPKVKGKNTFNRFQQNDYDFDSLESDLLANH